MVNGIPMLTTMHRFVTNAKKETVGQVRYRETPDGAYGFWQVKARDSKVWEGEYETLLEAELEVGGGRT
ncbi:MAG: hypothetical protein JXP37_05705 [Coriobacteriia bacterium]|nr:hypothetical protein [Coriobacteriia bacterium]